MALPSKYAPDGLSLYRQSKLITLGRSRQKKPTDYIIRDLESRIDDAAEKHHQNHNLNTDIEMIGMLDDYEITAVSDYVNSSRHEGEFSYEDTEMESVEESYRAKPPQIDHYGQHYQGKPQVQKYRLTDGTTSYLVIDTNFILSHLDVLDELKTVAEKYKLRVVIPVAVMRELDGLKNSTRRESIEQSKQLSGKSIGHLARWANDWIYSNLANSSAFIQGQKNNQRIDKTTIQDDAILDCCLYYVRENPESLVVLLSNDKNLCLKALANEVLTVSHRKEMTAELIAKVIHNENLQRYGIRKISEPKQVPIPIYNNATVSPSVVNSVISSTIQSKRPQNINRPQSNSFHQGANQISSLDQVSHQIYSEIQTLTLSVIHHCMETVYGEDLILLRDYEKESIATLSNCAEVFIRFWFPVFQDHFRNLNSKIKPFEEHGKRNDPIHIDLPHDRAELRLFVEFWIEILEVLYSGEMDDSQNEALTVLSARWRGLVDSV